MDKAACSSRWGCTSQRLLAQRKLSSGLKCHSFSWTRGLHELRILRNRRLKSFRVLNGQGSKRQNWLGIFHWLPPLGGSFSTLKAVIGWATTTSFTTVPLVAGEGTSTCKRKKEQEGVYGRHKKKKNIYIYIYINTAPEKERKQVIKRHKWKGAIPHHH